MRDGFFFVKTYSFVLVSGRQRAMFLRKLLAQEKVKNAPAACLGLGLYNFRFFIRAHEIPCQDLVSSTREKSDLTIGGNENPFSDKRGQKNSR